MSSVSVVIPCYNYGRYLPEAVGSALSNQPGVDVRVLIIDDASPDDSAQVAKEIAAADPRVELRVHTDNQGGIATYNEGIIDWADGDYTVLLSADDQLTPGALTRATEFMDAHPSVGFVYGHPLHFVQGQPLPAARTAGPGQFGVVRPAVAGEAVPGRQVRHHLPGGGVAHHGAEAGRRVQPAPVSLR